MMHCICTVCIGCGPGNIGISQNIMFHVMPSGPVTKRTASLRNIGDTHARIDSHSGLLSGNIFSSLGKYLFMSWKPLGHGITLPPCIPIRRHHPGRKIRVPLSWGYILSSEYGGSAREHGHRQYTRFLPYWLLVGLPPLRERRAAARTPCDSGPLDRAPSCPSPPSRPCGSRRTMRCACSLIHVHPEGPKCNARAFTHRHVALGVLWLIFPKLEAMCLRMVHRGRGQAELCRFFSPAAGSDPLRRLQK